MDVHGVLADSVGDFDDRRMALLEPPRGGRDAGHGAVPAAAAAGRRAGRRAGRPAAAGAARARRAPRPAGPAGAAVHRRAGLRPGPVEAGGWAAVRTAWDHPPESTEQVLHPSKYLAGETPRPESVAYAPPGGRVINEGVLGEMLTRTLLGDDGEGGGAAGWGGDALPGLGRVGEDAARLAVGLGHARRRGASSPRRLGPRLAASPGASGRRGAFEVFGTRRLPVRPRRSALGETALVSSDDRPPSTRPSRVGRARPLTMRDASPG